MIKLIVGLGNPGMRYARTSHNAGFLAVRWLSTRLGAGKEKNRIRLMKNEGFMNEAGRSVAFTVRRMGITPEELLVIHDESDLPLGAHRFSLNRGAAGHKGVESVIRHLGTKAFWRLRLGIRPENAVRRRGRPSTPAKTSVKLQAGSFVLRPLSRPGEQALSRAFENALPELERLIAAPPAPRAENRS